MATAGALVVGATFAFFSDSGSSTNNVFNSGTLIMALSDNNETNQVNVSGTWGLASAPGDTFTGDLKVKNTGSVAANHVELKFTNTVDPADSAPGSTETTPIDRVIQITTLAWDANGDGTPETDLLSGVVDANGNSIKDLDDLENQASDDFDNLLFGGTQSADHVLRIEGKLHSTFTVDEHQGDSVSMSLDVTMNQDVTQ